MHYLWDEFSTYGDLILESNYDYDYSRHYTLANGMLLSHSQIIANQRVPSYYLSDAQGSTRALANLSGTITDSYTYDAFGTLSEHLNLGIGGNLVPNEDGIFGTHYLYTGQQFDPYTELYSLRARYYNPSLGRFLSRDTWAYNYQNPYELNRYVYTANNPVKYTDPSGHENAIENAMLNVYVTVTNSWALRVGVGATVGAMFGAIMGELVAINTYDKIRDGYCGSRTIAGISREAYIRSGVLWGAVFGGVAGAGAAAGGWVGLSVATLVMASGVYGATSAVQEIWSDYFAQGEFNWCAVEQFQGSVATVFSAYVMGRDAYRSVKPDIDAAWNFLRRQFQAGEGINNRVPLNSVRYTQATISSRTGDGRPLSAVQEEMANSGFIDTPENRPDFVAIPNSEEYMTLDHRRLVAASNAGLQDVPANIHDYYEPLPPELQSRFALSWRRNTDLSTFNLQVPELEAIVGRRIEIGSHPLTWGEAAHFRAFRQRFMGFPNFPLWGSPELPVVSGG